MSLSCQMKHVNKLDTVNDAKLWIWILKPLTWWCTDVPKGWKHHKLSLNIQLVRFLTFIDDLWRSNQWWQNLTTTERRQQGEYRAICLWKVGRQSFAIYYCERLNKMHSIVCNIFKLNAIFGWVDFQAKETQQMRWFGKPLICQSVSDEGLFWRCERI